MSPRGAATLIAALEGCEMRKHSSRRSNSPHDRRRHMNGARCHARRILPTLALVIGTSARFGWVALGCVVGAAMQMGFPASARGATVTVNSTSSVVDFAGARQVGDLP